MWGRRTDLPLTGDSLGRFLPWIVAFMVFLSALAATGALALGSLAGRWDRGVEATLTVQIPETGDPVQDKRRLEAATAALRAAPEVRGVDRIGETELARLLEPWLGGADVAGELPLPQVLDVELRTGAGIDLRALTARLREAVPDASLDDHRVWLDRLLRLVRAVEALALVILGLMAAATVATVIYTTRTGLSVHKDVIEVLHLIGAQDGYIARQFADRALTLGLQGGIVGLVFAIPTVIGIGMLGEDLSAGMLPDVRPNAFGWGMLALLPIAAAFVAMATARLTVMRALKKML